MNRRGRTLRKKDRFAVRMDLDPIRKIEPIQKGRQFAGRNLVLKHSENKTHRMNFWEGNTNSQLFTFFVDKRSKMPFFNCKNATFFCCTILTNIGFF